jgi:hypothetical protein
VRRPLVSVLDPAGLPWLAHLLHSRTKPGILCLDLNSWRVTSVRVRLRRDLLEELTLDRPLVGTQRISIPVDVISGITDAIVLRSTMAELLELLQCEGTAEDPKQDQDGR